MSKKKPRSIEVEYEGMGTCISADVKLGGKRVVNINAPHTQANKLTEEVIHMTVKHLQKKERERVLGSCE